MSASSPPITHTNRLGDEVHGAEGAAGGGAGAGRAAAGEGEARRVSQVRFVIQLAANCLRLSEEELDRRLFAAVDTRHWDRPLPDWEAVEKERPLRQRGRAPARGRIPGWHLTVPASSS